MILEEALQLFNITSITNLDKTEYKKVYRQSVKKYHPDNFDGNDAMAMKVIEANKLITAALNSIDSYEKFVRASTNIYARAVITLQQLIDIYKGDVMEIDTDKGLVKINKSNVDQHDIYVIIDFTANAIMDEVKPFTKIVKANMLREYSVDCEIETYVLEPTEVLVHIRDQYRKFVMNYERFKLPIKLDEGIKITVNLHKKLISQNGV